MAVGVDNGGTWIRLKGLDAQGRCIWSLRKSSPTVEKLPAFLHQHLKRWRGQLAGLAVGSRGIWKQAKRRALRRALADLAKRVIVMSDVEAAWLAAFDPHPVADSDHPLPKGRGHTAVGLLPEGEGGRRPDEGIIVISGTGSIAYGRTRSGAYARAGGLGPDKGDEGSGYWIGREWLLRNGKKISKRYTVRKIASVAPKVLSSARKKNPIACQIVEEAQEHLARLVIQLVWELRFKRTAVSWAGSVLQDPTFRRGFFQTLKPLSVHPKPPAVDSATALARSIIGQHAQR